MNFELLVIDDTDIKEFKSGIQEAFQRGFENVYGKTEEIILPEADIEYSLAQKGAIAYKAMIDKVIVGGAIIVIDEVTQHNDLDLLYVKSNAQSKGVGYKIWCEIERLHPATKVWKTSTPYFEKRNIHFYVNKCGFHIVEFINEMGNAPDSSERFVGDGGEGMFVFEKVM